MGEAPRGTSCATDNDGDEGRYTGYGDFNRERGPGRRLRAVRRRTLENDHREDRGQDRRDRRWGGAASWSSGSRRRLLAEVIRGPTKRATSAQGRCIGNKLRLLYLFYQYALSSALGKHLVAQLGI